MADKRFCPNCGSEDIDLEDGMMVCSDCGFRGNVFPEKELIGEAGDLDEDEELDEIKVKKEKKVKKKTKSGKGGKKK